MALKRRKLAAVVAPLLLGAGLLCVSIFSLETRELEARPLKPGTSVRREIRRGEIHFYRLSLETGRAFRVTLEPRHSDLVLSLLDPFRADRLQVNTRNGFHGPETLYAIAGLPGDQLLEIRLLSEAKTAGSYELKVDEPRPASKEDRLRHAAMVAFSRGEQFFNDGAFAGAATEYEQALDCWRRTKEPERESATLFRLCRALQGLGRWKRAEDICYSALEEVRSRGDSLAEASLLDRIGRSRFELGKLHEAAKLFQQTLHLFQQAAYRPGEADALNNLGLVFRRQGDFTQAMKLEFQALSIWEALGGRKEQSLIRLNLGELHLGLGEPELAWDEFERVLALSQGLEDKRLLVLALGGKGTAHSERGSFELALSPLEQAIDLAREVGYRQGEVTSLIRLGDVHTRMDHLIEARSLYEQALALSRREPSYTRGQAMALGNLGHVLDRLGRERDALMRFDQARSIFQELGDPDAVAKVLHGRAEAALGLGDVEAARLAAEGGIRIVESLRSPLPSAFSDRRSLYEIYIEILMQLHEQSEGDDSFARLAFEAAEAARSRSLLDEVKETQVSPRYADAGLLRQKAELERQLRELELKRWSLPSEGAADSMRAAIDREVRQLETGLKLVRTELEDRGLEGSPRALTVSEVQDNLDGDTVLLSYFLGTKRSFLWEVAPDRFKTHELPRRLGIEDQAKDVRELLVSKSRPDWRAWKPAIKKLSKTLLQPVSGDLQKRRLLVSPDGALHQIPFTALLQPGTLERAGPPGNGPASPRFLILDHRIVTVPSISMVAAARRVRTRRPPAPEAVAVLADPVFNGGGASGKFKQLPYTREEAEAIVKAAPPGRSFLAMGFQASRSTAIDPQLGLYRFVHFATHGSLRERPDLSWIVLSLIDEKGAPQDGFLRAFEIYDLHLSSDLVVLSACDTALGSERGGLVRAFLHAGSKSVAATLWKVPDHSTALLMEDLYQGLLSHGFPPDEALQRAQIGLLGSSRWKDPHYWAGFVLQGEWR